MGFYKDKKVLVTGGTGLIGIPLVEMLIEQGAEVRIVSLDDPSRAHPETEFRQVNLVEFKNCIEVCQGMDFVFHLAGIKGSPAMTAKRPASFFVPTITFNTNMMEAARLCGVERYLYTSTIGVYSPAEVFYEDDVWKTFPSEKDKFAGWAKRMGELQAQAYRIEYEWDKIAIVRPANVYGPFDNFDPDNAMVIPSLIRRALDGENPLIVWGDGSAIRDFIHAKDVARGMLLAMEKAPGVPINLGSGVGVTIKEIVKIIVSNVKIKPKVVWDTSKPSGDKKRVMDISRARSIGFEPMISIEDGIKETMDWYENNRDIAGKRYNVFTAKRFV
jgi:GDP-L-fucose synthase